LKEKTGKVDVSARIRIGREIGGLHVSGSKEGGIREGTPPYLYPTQSSNPEEVR